MSARCVVANGSAIASNFLAKLSEHFNPSHKAFTRSAREVSRQASNIFFPSSERSVCPMFGANSLTISKASFREPPNTRRMGVAEVTRYGSATISRSLGWVRTSDMGTSSIRALISSMIFADGRSQSNVSRIASDISSSGGLSNIVRASAVLTFRKMSSGSLVKSLMISTASTCEQLNMSDIYLTSLIR